MADRRRHNGVGLGAILGGSAPSGPSGPAWLGTKSVYLDRVDSYVSFGTVWAGTTNNQAFSFSCWIRPVLVTANEFVLGPTTSGGMVPLLQVHQSTIWGYNDYANVKGTISITANTWNHAIVTSAGGTAAPKLYINGVECGAVQSSGGLWTRDPNRPWVAGRADTLFYGGHICEVAVWRTTALTAGQAAAVYNGGVRFDARTLALPPDNYWPVVPTDNLTATTGTVQDYEGSLLGTPYNTTTGDLVSVTP